MNPSNEKVLDLLEKHLLDDKQAHATFIRMFEQQNESLARIEKNLAPISETYASVSNLGRWMMTLLVSLSLIAGTIWASVQIFNNSKI